MALYVVLLLVLFFCLRPTLYRGLLRRLYERVDQWPRG